MSDIRGDIEWRRMGSDEIVSVLLVQVERVVGFFGFDVVFICSIIVLF